MGNAKTHDGAGCISMQAVANYEILRKSPLFSEVATSVLFEIVPKMRYERMPRGYWFDNQSQLRRYFYILVEGRVKICRSHSDSGRELTLSLAGAGEGFSVLNLIDGGAPEDDIRVSVVEDIRVLYAPITQWLEWIEQYPLLRKSVHRAVLEQIGQIRGLASELAFDDAKTRLVHLLLRYFDESSPGLCLIDDLTQEELANMIGSVRPVVARLLSQLRHEGLIDRVKGKLCISDIDRLKSLA